MKKLSTVTLLTILTFTLIAQRPQIPKRIYETQRLASEVPLIDGQLTDQIWLEANKDGNYVQFEPHEGIAPTFDTEFAILHDADHLYVGIWAYDPHPDSISRRMSRRDQVEGDLVGVDFDSYHDHRTSFGFWVSASGVKFDRVMTGDGNTEDPSWDPNWEVRTAITDEGWTAEMKIPFSQLRFEHSSEGGWGLNMVRYVFRKQEVSIWQRIPKGSGGFVSYYGDMTGLNGIRPKKQMDITPYTVASAELFEAEEGNPFRSAGRDQSLNAGVDAKIGITHNLTLDLTVNPDFGQVEADPSQVNLTAYETFFEEKRPFFIEGRSILSLPLMIGDGDLANENLFYTRRIGRRPQGGTSLSDGEYADYPSFTPILGAAKLTGKTEDGWSIGLLESLTGQENAAISGSLGDRSEVIEPLTNYFIGSLGRDFNEGNTVVKGLVTAVHRKTDGTGMEWLHRSAYTGGFDFTQFFKNKTYILTVKTYFSQVNGSEEALLRTQQSSSHYFQRPDAPHLQVDSTRTSLFGNGGSLMFGQIGNSNLQYGAFMNWKTPGVELNDVGYIRSSDELLPILFASYRFYEPFSIFRTMRYNASFWSGFDWSGRYLGSGGNVNGHAQFTNFWSVGIGLNLETKGISNAMLRGGPSFKHPQGIRPWVYATTDSRKRLVFSLNGFGGISAEQYNQSVGANLSISYRPWNVLQIMLEPNVMIQQNQLQYITQTDYMDDPRYIFGTIDQKVIGMSLRMNLTITPDLTIQYWGQPFMAVGRYDEVKMITDPMAENYSDRYHTFSSEQIECFRADGYCLVDENQDGTADYEVDFPDFNFKEFKSNLVARWEYKPGSVFYLVWSQGRNAVHGYGDLDFTRDMSHLYQVHPHNVFLIKFSYRFGL